MLANVFTKTIRDRQLTILIGALGVISVAVMGLASYANLDETVVELYESMPEAFLSVLGMSEFAGTGSLILGEIANLMAPMVLGGLAISMGTAAVAGEERKGTFGVLLGNPLSRQSVVISKSFALILLTVVGAILIWGGSYLTALAFDTDMSRLNLGAAMVHVVVIALFFGFLALFLGSWTGNGTVSSGTSTGLLILSFLAAGLLPLVESLSGLAKIFPWYYFNSSEPLANGIDWGHLAVLMGAVVVFAVGAIVGVNRRDLRIGEGSGTLVQKLREHPMTEKIVARLGGKAKVSSVAIKTASESQTLAVVAGLVILYTALLVGPMYNGLSDVLSDFSEAIPEALLAMIGFVDMGTPEGWYQTEVFSITMPGALIVVTAMMGARALAGEEEDNTMDLLLANPIKRSRVVIEKAGALAIIGLGLGFATFAGTMAGSLIGGLDLSFANVAVTSLLGALLGIFFGYVALAVSAGTGQRRAAIGVAAGLAFLAYFANAFLPVSATLAGWARLSPFYYYLGNDPLVEGLNWGDAAVLIGLCVVALGFAVFLFKRRDVRG